MTTKPRPFLKWVGGKSQLVTHLTKRLPKSIGSYFEPFVGGGALFFYLQPEKALLADVNHELMGAYQAIRDNVDIVIANLQLHRYDKAYYYEVRALDRGPAYAQLTKEEKAARLIYLNKSCFNGLHRVNAKGHFNVPFGRYTNPKIVDVDNLKSCSRVLKGIDIACLDYKIAAERAIKGDFIYFDPPYMPISTTSNFTSYTKDGFDENSQIELMQLCKELDSKGVSFMVSNSTAPLMLEIYRDFDIEIVTASRAINSVASKRGVVDEIIVRNF